MDKTLVQQLKDMRHITPDADWKKSNRDILFCQISNSTPMIIKNKFSWSVFINKLVRRTTQPAFVLFAVIIMVAAVFGFKHTNNAKPGDSLYIAKVISEKAQLAVTFDEDKKNKLGIKFAASHAKEITKVLSNPETHNTEDFKKVEKLQEDFKREIGVVKNTYNTISDKSDAVKHVEQANNTATAIENEPALDQVAVMENATSSDIDEVVHIADSFRDDEGLEIHYGASNNKDDAQATLSTIQAVEIIDGKEHKDMVETKLQEAEALFAEEKYDDVLVKLEEVDRIIAEEMNSNQNNEDQNAVMEVQIIEDNIEDNKDGDVESDEIEDVVNEDVSASSTESAE